MNVQRQSGLYADLVDLNTPLDDFYQDVEREITQRAPSSKPAPSRVGCDGYGCMALVWARGHNSSVDSVFCPLSCVMQHRRFDPRGRGDFSIGVSKGFNSIPYKTLSLVSDESINRDLVCAYMHSIAWT